MKQLGELLGTVMGAQSDRPAKQELDVLPATVHVGTKSPTIPTPMEASVPERKVQPDRGYLARELVQCTLPHNDPKSQTYIRKDGNFRLIMQSGVDDETGRPFGLPYGTLPRLLMLYVNTEAVRKQGKEDARLISFGNTLNEFLRLIGCNPATGGGKRGDAARVKAQHQRLFNTHFTFVRKQGDDVFGQSERTPIKLTSNIQMFWDYRNPNQGSFWDSFIMLDPDFHSVLISNAVPFDFDHIRQIKRSALAIDLYTWLTYRLYRADNQGFVVPYSGLYSQFGTGYARQRAFKAAMIHELDFVSQVFTDLRYEFTPGGLAVEGISRRDLPVPATPKPMPSLAPTAFGVVPPPDQRPYDRKVLHVNAKDLRIIESLCSQKGMRLDDMLTLWRAFCEDNKIVPKNAAASFTDFVKKHNPGRLF